MEKNKKRISFIIPTYNRSKVLLKCLSLVEKQIDKQHDEVLIIDDGSTKAESSKVVKFIKNKKYYKYVYKKNEGPAIARNIAIQNANGSILIFINDDTLIKKRFVDHHFKFHQESKVNEALIGRFSEYPKLVTTPIMKWLVWESNLHFPYRKSVPKILPWGYFITGNLSIKKEFLISNNLNFDSDFNVAAWEDIEFGYRAFKYGLEICFSDKVSVWHNHNFEYKDVLGRFFSHGRGLYTLSQKIPYETLPMLARKKYRLLARIILYLTIFPIMKYLIEKKLKIESHPNNLMLQYLIVGEKIRGWDYESDLLKSGKT